VTFRSARLPEHPADLAGMPALRRDLLSSVSLDHHVAAFDAPQEIDVQG
jgi:hypothetical protein